MIVQVANVLLLSQKEMGEAWRNRWFLLYALAFTGLALAMAWISVAGLAGVGTASLGRTAASLIHLVMLVVPLMGISLGATAIAGERERGSLLYLLTQPVDTNEVVVGKLLGVGAAVLSALLIGFGLAGLVIAGRGGGGDVRAYVGFLGLSALMAAASASIGLLISTLASRSSMASGVGLFVWLALSVLGDLGLMGTSFVLRLRPGLLLAGAMLNPLQVFKMAALLVLRGGLEELGPAGLFAMRAFGDRLLLILIGVLTAWIAVPFVLSLWGLRRRGAIP
jgi:Cu-processing system permease protein